LSPQRIVALVLGLALVGAYGYRAVIGIGAGVAWDDGIHEILSRDYREAIPSLEKAAVGFNRYDMQRRMGDARIDVFEAEAHRGGPFGADTQLLYDTARDYMEALCSSPAARHPWEGLALVYQKLEWMGRERRTEQPFVRGVEPWSRVGRSGRIAIGMGRQAIEASPNWYLTYDWMAETFWLFGLEPEARDAVRRSAKALPLFFRHAFARRTVLPGWEKELFFESSRETLGMTPLLPRANHLVDLGKQARGRGAHEDAVEVLTQALGEAKFPLVRAEAHFNLGLSLVALGRDVDGREQLILASEHPVFHEPALWNLLLAAEKVEDYAGALTYVRELQREEPRELAHCLRAARLAGMLKDWPVALEALRWGKTIAPTDPRPYVRLVETYLEMGDLTSARTAFRDVDAWGGEAVPESLRRQLAED
jgi:tetratricopeptide (TPR) repeat protein